MQIITHPSYVEHAVAEGHPERPARIAHLLAHLENLGLQDNLVTAPSAEAADILRAHPQSHLAFIESMVPSEGVVPVDPDTWMGPASYTAAVYAAGAVCKGVLDAVNDVAPRSFCAVRPPGHHAESDAAMGFCLFNSVAVGALLALEQPGIERVAIFDFDVHHGNGTVEIFHDRPEVLVCSTFQHPFYPHRFFESDWSNIVNSPLEAGSDGSAFRKAVETDWAPAVEAHEPDLILVSAGFDAHVRDPLAALNFIEDDFAWVTRVLRGYAQRYTDDRIVSVLEGGYDLDALASSTEAHLKALY